MDSVDIFIKRLDRGLSLPGYARAGDAGADLSAAESLTLGPGERALVATGIAVALPDGYVALIHPRSGLAVRHGVTVVNAPGTVDSGYRGEIKVALLNTDKDNAYEVKRGDRIAQMVVQRYSHARFAEVDELPESSRGSAGFGSSGGFGVSREKLPITT